MRESFKGTLFRFPLRTQQQAALSEINTEPFTHDDVDTMIQAFICDGSECLLHLNNVRTFEIYKWEAGAERPTLICEIRSQKEQYEQPPEVGMCLSNFTSLQITFHYNNIHQ